MDGKIKFRRIWLTVIIPMLLLLVSCMSWMAYLIIATQISISREVAVSLNQLVVLNLRQEMATRDGLQLFVWLALGAFLLWIAGVFFWQARRRRKHGVG